MTNLENGVALFIDSDGTLCWKTADGIVRRGAKVTKRDAPGECGTMEYRLLMERAVLGSSAVDIGVGSASTVCVRDGADHLPDVVTSDGVRVADVAASLDRIADALNNDPAPRAVVSVKPRELSARDCDDRPIEQQGHESPTAAPVPPRKPIVRCGQRWRLDGVEVEIYDSPSGAGLFMARNWDGVRVPVFAADLQERGVFLSGPTKPETKAEAVRRVLELEAANPPNGVGRDEWRARIINRMGEGVERIGTAHVRTVATWMREEHAEKWRKFGGGR